MRDAVSAPQPGDTMIYGHLLYFILLSASSAIKVYCAPRKKARHGRLQVCVSRSFRQLCCKSYRILRLASFVYVYADICGPFTLQCRCKGGGGRGAKGGGVRRGGGYYRRLSLMRVRSRFKCSRKQKCKQTKCSSVLV